MDRIRVEGGRRRAGEVAISGAKNACLALMPAALLTDRPLTLSGAPRRSDIATMTALLRTLGVEIAALDDGRVLALSATGEGAPHADYEIVRKLRASILVLGPLLARGGRAEVSLPGGCAIGARPVDLHLSAMEALGAAIDLSGGYVTATAPRGLRGARIAFAKVSVGATENALMAASLARGPSVIENAACEPEIVDLAACLSAMGARIEGAGTGRIEIEGVERLGAATHDVLPDRGETGTYMIAPAIAGGRIVVRGARRELVGALIETLEEAGVAVEDVDGGLSVERGEAPVRPVRIATAPFPGFPTDLQAQTMALLATASGESVIEETIFENRFMHVPELARMGADIAIQGGVARIRGVERLKGAPVMATDLRASISLILAGLAAEGATTLSRVYHLDRGYERVEEKLGGLGAAIERIGEDGRPPRERTLRATPAIETP
ncbi:MAG: UDP-N-acetylglucosamine 1-carboxyvinyltransferase [Paracoccaceae bacterium]